MRSDSVTSSSGTLKKNVQCILSRLELFYYDWLSIKCCKFAVASVVAYVYVATGRVYWRTLCI